jgi:tellurite resistance protein TerC
MFIGVKMLISEFVHIPIAISLGVVAAVLGGSVIASLLLPAGEDTKAPSGGEGSSTPAKGEGERGDGGNKGEHRAA